MKYLIQSNKVEEKKKTQESRNQEERGKFLGL